MNEKLRKAIDRLLAEQDRVTVAIDGCCASGKTTLAAEIEKAYDCNVFHMDDFFLQPHQRTPERLAEPGGNVDYERFREAVLLPMQKGEAFFYRPYDCSARILSAPVAVVPKKLNIVEGSYSHHPFFGQIYDLKVVLSVDAEVQKARILERPAFLHRRFFEEWIPMENRYFEAFSIGEKCDMILGGAEK